MESFSEFYINREIGEGNNYMMSYVSFVDLSLLYLECTNIEGIEETKIDYPDNSELKELDTGYYLSKTVN